MTIQFLFNENKIEAMSKVFDFLLIIWKRNKIFKWKLKTATGFSCFPSLSLIVTEAIESDHFFLKYVFQVFLSSVILVLPMSLTAFSENHNQMTSKKQWGLIFILQVYSTPKLKS